MLLSIWIGNMKHLIKYYKKIKTKTLTFNDYNRCILTGKAEDKGIV